MLVGDVHGRYNITPGGQITAVSATPEAPARFRVPSKVRKSRKYWPRESVPGRIRYLLEELTTIREALGKVFEGVMLELPEPGAVKSLAALKRYEDALDALVCAWVGVEYLAGRAVPLGDDDAAIWCPKDVVRTSKQG